jgi:hypothetical protein
MPKRSGRLGLWAGFFGVVATAATAAAVPAGAAGPGTAGDEGWPGQLGGAVSWHWRLRDMPNGLKPTQSWHATASSPDGDIYVAGMDHSTDAALYRLTPGEHGAFRYVGDARSASEVVGDWAPGETAQKFHTRPLWHRGKVYVGTMDRSGLDDEYLSRRGYHLYAYDPRAGTFTDVSAAEPGGTAVDHGFVVSLASDPVRNVIYGAGVPTGEIYRYDVAAGRTERLGRPASFNRKYVYAGRVMWLDARGRLYFSAGNPAWGTYDPSVFSHIYYYDPATGAFGEHRDWLLQDIRAIEAGQCLPGIPKRCVFTDDAGHIYRFDDDPAAPQWSYVGHAETEADLIWAFEVSADGRKAYIVASSFAHRSVPPVLYEVDLTDGAKTRRLCTLGDLSGELARLKHHTGYDAWDREGRFYVSSFSPNEHNNVIVSRIDPVRLKVALHVLPALTEVAVERVAPDAAAAATARGGAGPQFLFRRTAGSVLEAQQVLYRLTPAGSDGGGGSNGAAAAERQDELYGTITIPPGATSVSITLRALLADRPDAGKTASHGVLTVVPNGDDYIVGSGGVAIF